MSSRNGNKWTVNEILNLQREYELLELSVQDIALKHKRSVLAILCKLQQEGFIESWNEARGYNLSSIHMDETEHCSVQEPVENIDFSYQEDVSPVSNDTDSETNADINKLADRVWGLETSVSEISFMVKQMFDSMISSKPKKRFQLRNY